MSLNPSKMDALGDKIDTQAEQAQIEADKAVKKAKADKVNKKDSKK